MDYLTKTLGIKIKYERYKFTNLPNFINSRYELKMVILDSIKTIFLYPKENIEQYKSLDIHINRIKKEYHFPVVLILNKISYREKEYLIKHKIPFIVDGKQIYLPFMAVYLQEKCNPKEKRNEGLLPSTQLLLLYFIYNGAEDLSTREAANKLKLTPTSLSRASKQLEKLNLLSIEKIGVNKILSFKGKPSELFSQAKNMLMSPIKRTIYIPKINLKEDLLKSNMSALSEYSMLNDSNLEYYATDSVSKWNDVSTDKLIDPDSQVGIEMWRYNPKILSNSNAVDKLSLALSLGESDDERIELSIEEMLEDLWREIDG